MIRGLRECSHSGLVPSGSSFPSEGRGGGHGVSWATPVARGASGGFLLCTTPAAPHTPRQAPCSPGSSRQGGNRACPSGNQHFCSRGGCTIDPFHVTGEAAAACLGGFSVCVKRHSWSLPSRCQEYTPPPGRGNQKCPDSAQCSLGDHVTLKGKHYLFSKGRADGKVAVFSPIGGRSIRPLLAAPRPVGLVWGL